MRGRVNAKEPEAGSVTPQHKQGKDSLLGLVPGRSIIKQVQRKTTRDGNGDPRQRAGAEAQWTKKKFRCARQCHRGEQNQRQRDQVDSKVNGFAGFAHRTTCIDTVAVYELWRQYSSPKRGPAPIVPARLILDELLGLLKMLVQIGHERRPPCAHGSRITGMRLVLTEDVALGIADMNVAKLRQQVHAGAKGLP